MLHNKIIAGLICFALMATSSVVGGALTLGQMRAQAQSVFYIGQGPAMGIPGDLNEISAQAHNITVIAQRYLADDYPALTRVHDARSYLQRARNPRENYRATHELLTATHALRATLDTLDLSTQDQNLLAGAIAEINNRLTLINAAPYNQAAFRFNQALDRFPANIFGSAAGIRPLELFE